MIQIRTSSFETNSSSVHILVIPKDTTIHVPKTILLDEVEYGWNNAIESDTINYLYGVCVERGPKEVQLFIDYLKRKGVEDIICKELQWEKGFDRELHAKNWTGSVSDYNLLPLEDLFANENLLDRFLFSEDSFVEMGNDNIGETPSVKNYDPEKYDTIKK